ncbi:MAG: hypothetical protein U9O98_09750, partial [Asgard group archaeon]|nr:hypothetical protein [Asgard group archaeon]
MATPPPPSTTPFLDRIGLELEQQKVYLALLALGPLTKGEIRKYTEIQSIPKIEKILDTLKQKQYAYQIEGLVDKAVGVYPYREIAAEAENDAEKIDQLVKELKQYVADQIKHFNKVMKDTEDFVQKESSKAKKKITDMSAETRNSIRSKNEESLNTIESQKTSTSNLVTTTAKTFLDQQTGTTDEFETTTSNNLKDFTSTQKEQITSFATAIQTNIESFHESSAKALDSFASKTDTVTTDFVTKSNQNISLEEEKSDELLEEIKTDSNTKLQKLQNHIQTENTDLINTNKEQLEQSTD